MRRIFAVLTVSACFAAELPVREVILYKNGVGYFEREGEIKAGESAKLDFKASEMNDVLKSLTIHDTSGGKISGIRYDSSEPLAQKLSIFPFTTEDENASLSSFLNQLKGSRIALTYAGEKVSGIIMLARTVPADEKRGQREQLVAVLDTGEIRTVDLAEATGILLEDAALQAQLRDYLRVLAGARSQEKRSVYIDSVDSGSRKLVASYMIPAPVWKSSYRLIFGAAGEPFLEGWAIVDNTTGEDWTKIRLALVSGRPISFISSLYEPRHIHRQSVDLADDGPQRPIVHDGVVGGVPGGTAGGVIGGIVGSAPRPVRTPPQTLMASKEAVELTAPSTVANTSVAREVGELFEYGFSHPVTVRTGESAMLPFLQQKIGARKLLIYSDHSLRHPMNAAELSNTTGKTLDGGPLTVFDANTYAGEALMNTVKTGDKRLISYAVDLGTLITTNLESDSRGIREVHFKRGVLLTRHVQRFTRTYTIQNVDSKTKTLMIEHPLRGDAKVISQPPSETTATARRFEVKLAANGNEKFPIIEEVEYENSTNVTSLNSSALLTYVQNRALNEAARKQLERLHAAKQRFEDIERSARQTETDIQNLAKDQERIRENIQSLNQVTGQQEHVQRYARTLSDQETKLEGLRTRQADLVQRRGAAEAEISTIIDNMEF